MSVSSTGRIGYRMSIANMALAANLICAVKFNKDGVQTRAVVPWEAALSGDAAPAPEVGGLNNYQSISCLFGADVNRNILNSSDDVMGTFARLWPMTFTKSMQPQACVRNQTIFARAWGYETPTLGDNVGSLGIPLCKTSQFKEDIVSLSWSPVILDIRGNGIRISRTHEQSACSRNSHGLAGRSIHKRALNATILSFCQIGIVIDLLVVFFAT